MNSKADPGREVTRRIRERLATLARLHIYFYNSDNAFTRKLQMFHVIIRSKVMYIGNCCQEHRGGQ